MVGFGVVGIGGFAGAYLRAIDAVDEARLVAAVVRNPAKYASDVEKLKSDGVEIVGAMDDLLSLDGVDVVAIPTGIATHAPFTVQALRAGRPVIVEKPPAATVQEVDSMIDAARASGKFCAVGFQTLSSVLMQRLKERVVSGELGRVKKLACIGLWKRLDSYYDRNPWAGKLKDGDSWILDGPTNNPLAHQINNMLFLASPEPRASARPLKVRAGIYRGHEIEGEDTSSIHAVLDGGAELFFLVTLCATEQSPPYIEIECEHAFVRLSPGKEAEIEHADGRKEKIEGQGDAQVRQFENICRAFCSGEPLNCPVELTRNFTLVVNGAYESARRIGRIPESIIRRTEEKGSVATYVEGLDELVRRAFDERKLFSEVGADWAREGDWFSVEGYERFDPVIES